MYLINNGDILYDHSEKCYLNLKYDPYDLEYYNFRKYHHTTPVEVSDKLYINKHKITTEYLDDDKDIDYILKWRLLPVNITDK